uniref:Uncharacterized protein n=1 Tax=Meloidogyne enterolobii TaxID=390850 RepID=A0A6V7XF65_MELEN|nr:unnamed protein product [Meloidogyne enterolobii]
MADDDIEQKRKNDERERKKAEGFLTPERKKKLRKLLMMKAAEDLKKQQMLKEQERQSVLNERIVPLPELESSGEDELQRISKEFAESVIRLEREKYDLSYTVRQKDFEINELTIAVNDLRGKFVKPTLKKVSKFAKLKTKEGQKVDFRNNLKTVEKKQFALEEKDEKIKVEWSKN